MDKKRIFKDYFVFSAGSYISQAIGMLAGFLMRIFLEPYYMGIWQGVNVIKSYASYTNLGVSRSAAREIAYFGGKKDKAKAEELKNTGFTFSLIMILLLGLGCIIFAFNQKAHLNSYIFWGFLAVGVIVVLSRLEGYVVTVLRAKKKFVPESAGKVCSSLLNLVLIIIVVRHFKLYGLYVSHIMVLLAGLTVYMYLGKETFRFSLNLEDLRHLIKIGIPLVLLGFMFVNLTNVDRIVIIKMLGLEKMGLYSIAIMMGNIVHNIANMGSIVLYPRFQETYAKNDDKKEVFSVMTKTIKVLWLPLLAIVLLGVLVFPPLVRMLLPKYTGGIEAMKIFLFGIYFLSLAMFCSNFLVTINRQTVSLVACVAVVLINLSLNIILVMKGFGIEGVAAATSISYFIYFIVLYLLSIAEVRRKHNIKGVK